MDQDNPADPGGGNDSDHAVAEAASRVVDLEAELEASGDATTGGDALARSREVLHRWVDSVVGVVSSLAAMHFTSLSSIS